MIIVYDVAGISLMIGGKYTIKIRYLMTVTLLSVGLQVAFCQELIQNGGFELLSKCPEYVGDIECATGWHNGGQTPDLFNTCTGDKENGLNIPDSYQGNIIPINGNSCAGLVLFVNKGVLNLKKSYDYSESIWVKSSKNLSVDRKYSISLWVALADSSLLYSDYITVTLSMSPFSSAEQGKDMQVLVLNIGARNYDYGSRPWIQLTSTFISNKPWRFISVGMSKKIFSYKDFVRVVNNNNTLYNKNAKKSQDINCYYYVDDISLKEIVTQ